jgi:hypothetical protein
VQRLAALGLGMAASGSLAVDRHEVRLRLAQLLHPSDEAGLEQLGVERVDHAVEGIVGGNPVGVRQEMAQETQPFLAPSLDLDEVFGRRQRRAQDQKEDLRQGIEHLGDLPRVGQCRKMVQQG